MNDTQFTALEYQPDATFATANYRLHGSPEDGWTIERNGRHHLSLPTGYRLLQSATCGVCSTDLARRFLPFPLPQIIGHEVTAVDEHGQRCTVEINASHRARGAADQCAFCRAGLDTHCPDRLVLGIHDLPGGFGPYILAPIHAVLPIPREISDRCDVLIEPLAAALHAVHQVAPQPGDHIAVLGPRKLGMLILAALAAHRRRHSRGFTISAWARRPELLGLAQTLGADAAYLVGPPGSEFPREQADVVIDTTGTPDGLTLALHLARREIHLKSTHGRAAAGLEKLTALVVDEIALKPFPNHGFDEPVSTVAWLSRSDPPSWLSTDGVGVIAGPDAATVLKKVEQQSAPLPRVDAAVVDNAAQVDDVIRPSVQREVSLVRPRGTIYITQTGGTADPSPLVSAVANRHLRLSSSRCGSFQSAITFLQSDPKLRQDCERLITHIFSPRELAQAFRVAGSTECVKAIVQHGDGR